MATVGIMGPYHHKENLSPGQRIWIFLPEPYGFKDCALSMTAAPLKGYPTGPAEAHVLKVDNVNVTGIAKVPIPGLESGQPITSYSAGCHVTNTGTTTITEWNLTGGVTAP